MSKKDIIALPNPKLRQRSKRVGYIDEHVAGVVERMVKATLDWESSRNNEVGVALAAVQIGELLRIVIIRSNLDDKDDKEFQILINPEVVKQEGKVIKQQEGCLSIANIYGLVPRHEKVKIKAVDITGKSVRLTATGFLARVLQHEIDHMHGKLYIDHVKNDEFYYIKKDGKLEPLKPGEIKKYRLLWNQPV